MKSNLTNRYVAIAFIAVLSCVFSSCEYLNVEGGIVTSYKSCYQDKLCDYRVCFSQQVRDDCFNLRDTCGKFNIGDTLYLGRKNE